MKYLCLGYLDREAMDSRPKAEIDQLMQQCQPHMEAIGKTGQMLMAAGLEPETKGLRRSRGKLLVSDGPFIETKELLGSVFVIEASDFDDAVRVAALHPTTQIAEGEALGWRLEIRPIHFYESRP